MKTRVEQANEKLLQNISHTAVQEFIYWAGILEHFPVTKKGRVNLILKTNDKSVFMGIAVEHLKSVASIVGIPNTYIQEICKNQKWYREHKNWGKEVTTVSELKRDTYLLLKSVYHKVLQTGEE